MAAGAVGVPQQRPGALAVLGGRGGDYDVQDQPGGVDGDVPLAAAGLLGVVPAAGGLGHRVGRAHGLRVDDRRGGVGLGPGSSPDQGAQLGVRPG
jgi:hypothetical protein